MGGFLHFDEFSCNLDCRLSHVVSCQPQKLLPSGDAHFNNALDHLDSEIRAWAYCHTGLFYILISLENKLNTSTVRTR